MQEITASALGPSDSVTLTIGVNNLFVITSDDWTGSKVRLEVGIDGTWVYADESPDKFIEQDSALIFYGGGDWRLNVVEYGGSPINCKIAIH